MVAYAHNNKKSPKSGALSLHHRRQMSFEKNTSIRPHDVVVGGLRFYRNSI